jgi:hypothetical protein
MEYKYIISNDYVLEDLDEDITKSLKKFMKKDRNSIEKIQNYVKDPKIKFCRDSTSFADFLAFNDDYFSLYENKELYALAAISFNFKSDLGINDIDDDDEDDNEEYNDKIIGINILYFCSKQKGYGGLLLKKIIELCNDNSWYIKLKATNENNTRFYERYDFIKEKDEYHYYRNE